LPHLPGYDCCSDESISFHYVKVSCAQQLLHVYHAP
jgi:hypothetical protein